MDWLISNSDLWLNSFCDKKNLGEEFDLEAISDEMKNPNYQSKIPEFLKVDLFKNDESYLFRNLGLILHFIEDVGRTAFVTDYKYYNSWDEYYNELRDFYEKQNKMFSSTFLRTSVTRMGGLENSSKDESRSGSNHGKSVSNLKGVSRIPVGLKMPIAVL